jgi:hypothetical protein
MSVIVSQVDRSSNGGEWVDVNFVLFFGRVVWVPASREARLGRRVSDCVVASQVWGEWVDLKVCFVLSGASGAACIAGGSFTASRLGLRRCF